MRKTLATTALAALIALPMLAASTDADASCTGRKNTGTAIGAIGGALLGNSVSKGGGGAVVGGLGGAVIGHEIAKGGCGSSRAYYRHRGSRYASNRAGYNDSGYNQSGYSQPNRAVYYDRNGNPVSSAYEYRR